MLTVTYLPPGPVATAPDGAQTASTASGGTLVLASRAERAGDPAPFADRFPSRWSPTSPPACSRLVHTAVPPCTACGVCTSHPGCARPVRTGSGTLGAVATEKGERRRAALVDAAADLLRTGGFEAVRHRAVAEKAGLPLASTTYYFASLDDLVTAATERTCRDELAEVRAGLDALPADAPPAALAELVLDQLLGPESRSSGLEAVLLRYERLVGSGRRPYLAPLMRATRTRVRRPARRDPRPRRTRARRPRAAPAGRRRRRHRGEQPDRGRPGPARRGPRRVAGRAHHVGSVHVIPNVLAARYASPELVALWSPENKIVLERRLWIAVLRAQRDLGVDVPEQAIADYERVVEQVDLASIAARERVTRHDVKARIEEFCALAGHEHVHKGMTSRDLTENVEQLQIRLSLEHVRDRTVALLARLARRAAEHAELVMAGRSHNVAAQATTLGKRFATAADELLVAYARLEDLRGRYPLRGIKGPVGTAQDMLDLLGGDAAKLAAARGAGRRAPRLRRRVHQRRAGLPAVAGLRRAHRARPARRRAVVARRDDPADGGCGAGDRGVQARARSARRPCRTR